MIKDFLKLFHFSNPSALWRFLPLLAFDHLGIILSCECADHLISVVYWFVLECLLWWLLIQGTLMRLIMNQVSYFLLTFQVSHWEKSMRFEWLSFVQRSSFISLDFSSSCCCSWTYSDFLPEYSILLLLFLWGIKSIYRSVQYEYRIIILIGTIEDVLAEIIDIKTTCIEPTDHTCIENSLIILLDSCSLSHFNSLIILYVIWWITCKCRRWSIRLSCDNTSSSWRMFILFIIAVIDRTVIITGIFRIYI